MVAHQQVAVPGSVATVDLRDQAPGGTFDHATLRLDSGRYPTGPGEVAVTSGIAKQLGLRIGSTWTANGTSRQVVGIVENPLNLLDEFALVAPGQAVPPRPCPSSPHWRPGPGHRLGLPSWQRRASTRAASRAPRRSTRWCSRSGPSACCSSA